MIHFLDYIKIHAVTDVFPKVLKVQKSEIDLHGFVFLEVGSIVVSLVSVSLHRLRII